MSGQQPHSFKQPLTRKRRSGRSGTRVPTSFAIYDWIAILLLGGTGILGTIFYGAVNTALQGPFYLALWAGFLMFLIRPLTLKTPATLLLPPGSLLFAAFLVYAAIRVPFSAVRYDAWADLIRLLAGFFVLIGITNLLLVRKRGQLLVGVVFFIISIICWYGIVQAANNSTDVLNTVRPKQYGMRLSATYICPNHFAHLLVMLLPFTLSMAFIKSKKKLSTTIGVYSMLLFTPVLFMTLSRAGWIGAGLGTAFTFLLIMWKKDRRRFYVSLLVLPILAVVSIAILWFASPSFQERIQGAVLGSHDMAVAARLSLWKDTLPMIGDAILLGHGNGSYSWIYPRYQTHTMQYFVDFAHNEVLQFIAEYGLVGLLIFGSGMVLAIMAAARAYHRTTFSRNTCLSAALFGSLLGSLLHSLFDFNLHITANLHLQIILMAVVLASVAQSDLVKIRSLQNGFAIALRIVLGLLATGMMLHFARIYLCDVALDKAAEVKKTFNYDKAAKKFSHAAVICPDYFEPHLQLGDALRAQGLFTLGQPEVRKEKAAASLVAYQTAVNKNPYNLDANLGLSMALFQHGQEDEASMVFDRVIEFAHHDVFFLRHAAIQYGKIERYEKALTLINQAFELNKYDPAIIKTRNRIKQKAAKK